MKPLLLRISGINSFSDEQTINFKKLTDNGIFGIFGPTGSGKSTIIDAITIALYGKISRYDGSGSLKGFINTNCVNANVLFKFSVKDRIYSVERHFGIKKDGTYKPSVGRLIELCDGNESVISDKVKDITENIEKIIGLKYDDFTRSVVLPQGKFSEFLMLANKERRFMLERIFGLEIFGTKLSNKINEIKSKQKAKLDLLAAQNEDLSSLSFEDIEKEKILLKEEITLLDNIKLDLDYNNQLLHEIKNGNSISKELTIFENKLNDLLIEEDNINKDKLNLMKADTAYNILPYIEEYTNIQSNLQDIEYNYNESEKDYNLLLENFKTASEKYNGIIEYKHNNYYVLLDKEISLKNAIQLEDEISELNNQLTESKNYLYESKKEINEYSEIESGYLNRKDSLIEKFNKILEQRKELIIDSSYKALIENAADTEKNLLNAKIIFQNKINDKNKLIELINEYKNNVIKFEINLNETSINVKKISEELSLLRQTGNKFPETILELQNNIISKENEYNSNLKKFEYNNEISLKILNISSLLKQIEPDYLEKSKEINILENELKDIEIQISFAENNDVILMLASHLEDNMPCPVCGSTNHPAPAKSNNYDLLNDKLKNKKNECLKKLDSLIELQNELFNKISYNKIDLDKLKSEKNNLTNVVTESNLKSALEYLKSEKKKLDELINQNKYNLEQINTKEKELLEYNEILEKLKINIAEYNNSIQNYDKTMQKLDIEIDQEKENISVLTSTHNKNKLDLGIESFDSELKIIKSKEHKKEQLENEKEILEKEIELLNEDISIIKSKIMSSKEIVDKYTAVIQEKEYSLLKETEKLKKIVSGRNTKEYYEEIKSKIDNIIKLENKYTIEFNSLNGEKEKLYNSLTALLREKKTLSDLLNNKKDFIENLILNNEFSDFDSVKIAAIDNSEYERLKIKVNSFEDIRKDTVSNISRLKKELGKFNKEIFNINLADIDMKINELNKKIELKMNFIAEKKIKISNLEDSLNKSHLLIEEIKKENHRYDLICELYSVTNGNKFVEYVAQKHLKYIAKEASNRLMSMTNGKYSLELENTDFMIKDNFNGGILRTPKTLSGGEVFIVSLCLALALSSKIQLTNSAPLEIFFLDEGFGTLDNEMLDTVMDWLEKLHIEQVSVGIITHVEELKNRIQTKLIVEPQNIGISGTTVNIE